MTLLGTLALWLALLVGVWGALAGFVGGLKDRPDLARSARNAVFAMIRRPPRRRRFARVGVVPARLQRRVRRRLHQPQSADLLHLVGLVRRPKGEPPVLGDRAVGVRVACSGVDPAAPSRAPPLRGGRRVGRRGLLHLRYAVRASESDRKSTRLNSSHT